MQAFILAVLNIKIFSLSFPVEGSGKKVFPISQHVYEGENAVMICKSSTPPIWAHKGLTLQPQDKISFYGTAIYIHEVTKDDDGVYLCEGTDNNAIKFKDIAVVIVFGELKIINIYGRHVSITPPIV